MTIPRKAIGGNSEVANRRKVKTPALFIERIKSYLEKWIETAGFTKGI